MDYEEPMLGLEEDGDEEDTGIIADDEDAEEEAEEGYNQFEEMGM